MMIHDSFRMRVMRILSAQSLLVLVLGGVLLAAQPGSLLWKTESGEYHSPASTPDGKIVVIAEMENGEQLALFDENGGKLWTTSFELNSIIGDSLYPPAVSADGYVYVATDQDWMFIVDADGNVVQDLRWGNYRGVAMNAAGNALYTYYKPDLYSGGNELLVCTPLESDGLPGSGWRHELTEFPDGRSAFFVPRVSDHDGVTYLILSPSVPTENAGESYPSTSVLAFDASGEKLWQWDSPTVSAPASCIVFDSNGNLYFSTADGIVSLDGRGRQRWALSTPSLEPLQPAVSGDDSIFITRGAHAYGRPKEMYALDSNGAPIWVAETDLDLSFGSGVPSDLPNRLPVFDSGGNVYLTSRLRQGYDASGSLVSSATALALSPSGRVMWHFASDTHAGSVSSPLLSPDGMQLYFCDDTTLYAVAAGGTDQSTTQATVTLSSPDTSLRVGDEMLVQVSVAGSPAEGSLLFVALGAEPLLFFSAENALSAVMQPFQRDVSAGTATVVRLPVDAALAGSLSGSEQQFHAGLLDPDGTLGELSSVTLVFE